MSDERPVKIRKVLKTACPVSGEQTPLICIVHYDQSADNDIRPLTEQSFGIIQTAAEKRGLQDNPLHRLDDICLKIPEHFASEQHGAHRWCYKRFTDTSRMKMPAQSTATVRHSNRQTVNATSTLRAPTESTSSLLFPTACLFCSYATRTVSGKLYTLVKCQTKTAEETIKQAAREKNDFVILGKITDVDMIAREVQYHECCRASYTVRDRKSRKTTQDEPNLSHDTERSAYKAAFEHICKYIEEEVIAGGCVLRMTMLREKYLQHMEENYPEFYNPYHQTHKLKEKICNHFGEKVKFWQPNYKSDLIYSSSLQIGEAIEVAFETATSDSKRLEDAAMLLHRHIVQAQYTAPQMPWPPSADYLKSAICKPPSSVSDFLTTVITGKTSHSVPVSERNQCIAISIAEDLCAATTRGRWKMAKHLLLGMSLRHLTGSAQVMTLINRFGHCSSYSQVLELETAMAIQSKSYDDVLPCNITVEGNQLIHSCWDNFDILEETLSGAGTTHTTHGIVIQELKPSQSGIVTERSVAKTKQRTLKIIQCELPPCFSKKRVEPEVQTSSVALPTITLSTSRNEFAWMLCRSQLNGCFTVPMWSGWLSKTATPQTVQQSVIGYMPPILHPITQYATVQQCLVTSMEMTEKVKQEYTFVTMDLAAAKIALDIKWSDPLKYAKVIIHLGAFHIMCSYMGALGKMMSGSGLEEVIIEAGVCASGSIDKVISGKHYNRAMRVHQLLLDALNRLLLESFLAKNESFIEISQSLKDLAADPSDESLTAITSSIEFQTFFAAFNKFTNDIRQGQSGNTAKFWVQYMDCVWQLLRFQQAIKQNDFDQYLASMRQLCNLLFAADHLNYARYLPLYYLQLKTLSESLPGASDLLRLNGISVSRSSVPACRNAIDLTIEQTINRSAKSTGGIIGFSRNVSAYTRWCVTRHTRSTYVDATFDRTGMNMSSEDAHKSTQTSQIKQSELDVVKLIAGFRQFSNPFDMDACRHDDLFCLSSGQPASAKVRDDLMRYVESGDVAADSFLQQRVLSKTVNFHAPLKKSNLKTFASMAKKQVLSTSQNKAVEVKAERNLLGRLLLLSQDNDLDLRKIFCFPLSPIPWPLATADGCLVKTNKAQLLHILEELSECTSPALQSSVHVIDGNALLQSCTQLPQTFGELADQVFSHLPKSQVVHFVTDSYHQHSVKQFERDRRGQTAEYCLGGPSTKVPRDFKAFMLNAGNKTQLIRFLLSEWQTDKYAPRLRGRSLYFVCEERCVCLSSSNGLTTDCQEIEGLYSDQEEADTRIVLHCLFAATNESASSIVVRSPDTDVMIILLSYSAEIKIPLYFDTGSGNNRRIIDIQSVAGAVGADVCMALPGFHAFTGCDATSAFVRRGKAKGFRLMQHDSIALSAFADLGTSVALDSSIAANLERFVCSMYGKSSYTDVNRLRYDLFRTRYEAKSESKSFTLPQGVDLSLIPPCRSSLNMHSRRANYIAHVWRNAHVAYQKIPSPAGYGWTLEGEYLTVEWNEGDIMPQQLIDVLEPGSGSETDCDGDTVDETEDFDVEEDCEIDNIIDVVFEQDDEL